MKYALLQVSKLRWVIIEVTSTRSDGLRNIKYETFKIVSKPMPWHDARTSIKCDIEELPQHEADKHRPARPSMGETTD